jgi:hypothetical protein
MTGSPAAATTAGLQPTLRLPPWASSRFGYGRSSHDNATALRRRRPTSSGNRELTATAAPGSAAPEDNDAPWSRTSWRRSWPPSIATGDWLAAALPSETIVRAGADAALARSSFASVSRRPVGRAVGTAGRPRARTPSNAPTPDPRATRREPTTRKLKPLTRARCTDTDEHQVHRWMGESAASGRKRTRRRRRPTARCRLAPSAARYRSLTSREGIWMSTTGREPPRARSAAPPFSRQSCYGVGSAYEPPKMSELPNVFAGPQSCSGAGAGGLWPLCSACRQASTAGQSWALRASFHTAAP